MPMNVVLLPQRQSSKGMSLTWAVMEGVDHHLIFVGSRKLSPEELEAAEALGGTDDCVVVKVGSEVSAVVDDFSPQGEARYYGVAMVFSDGAIRSARFRAVPDAGTSESLNLSARLKGGGGARPAARPAAAAVPAARPAAAPSAAPAPRPASAAPAATAAEEDPLEARKRAQRDARARMEAERAGGAPPALGGGDAPAPAARDVAASSEPVKQPNEFPLEESFDARMSGGTQTWDGLRIYWERAGGVAAYEVIVSDHQIFGDELADALAGKADFTSAVAVAPSITAVIDNITPRESRGWYVVLARARDGQRTPHPFKVGDAAESGRPVAGFVNPNRTGEVRAEVEDLLGQARENWDRWRSDQDRGAQREARRLVGDAVLIFPGYPAAKALLDEMG